MKMQRHGAKMRKRERKTHVLVGNDLDTLDMAGRLKYLSQDIFRDTCIQASYVQGAFVWLRGSSTHVAASSGRRHHIPRHWGGDGGRDWVGVLGNNHWGKRWRRHMRRVALAITLGVVKLLLTRSAGRSLGRWRKRRSGRWGVLCHCCEKKGIREEGEKIYRVFDSKD